MVISDWTITEVASALAIKLRTGELSLEQHADVRTQWTVLERESLVLLPVSSRMFADAADFIDRVSGLRSGDALHLAVAAAGGHSLVTLDDLQAKAGPRCGVPILCLA